MGRGCILQAMQETVSSLWLNSSSTVKKKGASTTLSILLFCSVFESALKASADRSEKTTGLASRGYMRMIPHPGGVQISFDLEGPRHRKANP